MPLGLLEPSAISFQLSAFSHQLSAISYQPKAFFVLAERCMLTAVCWF
jgi:hypothetical protein